MRKEYIAPTNSTTVIDELSTNPMSALNTRLGNALSIDTNSFIEKIISSNGTEVDVTKKTYNLVNPIGKRTSMTIYDASIIESMEKIGHALYGKALLTYAICKEFSKIAESGKLENMGFKTIAEFGKSVYGLETSTVNHYARIGSTFINDDYSIKNGLPELSVSHFIELSSKVVDGDITPIIDLYSDGTLVDGMSTKKIRETLKSLNTIAITDNSMESESEPINESNPSYSEVVSTSKDGENIEVDFDSQVAIGKIINACTVIESLFEMLNQHNITATGYADNLDAIKALAKTLL